MDEETLYELHAHVFGEDRYWGAMPWERVGYMKKYLASVYPISIDDIMIVRAN